MFLKSILSIKFSLQWLTALLSLLAISSSAQVSFQANDTEGCTPMGVVISVTSPAAGSISSYSWQITTPTGSILTATTAQYVAIFSTPGTYDVSLTINGNQTQTQLDYVVVHGIPEPDFVVDDPEGCFPLCVQFSDASTAGEGNITEWSWDFGNGATSTQQNPNYCYTSVGTFTPVLSVEDEFGCFADIAIPGLIEVQNLFPVSAFNPSSQLDCNPPVDISMANTSAGNSALVSSWDFGDGSAVQTVNGITAVNHQFSSTGTFSVCLTVSTDIGCEHESCEVVEIFDHPTPSFSVNDNQICAGQLVVFTNTTNPTPPQVKWDFDGDGDIESINPVQSYTYANAGNYNPGLVVVYSPTCSDTLYNLVNISVSEGLDVDFTADSTSSCSAPFTVHFTNNTTGTGNITYVWYINGAQVATSQHLTYTFNSYDVYDIKLQATNDAGCVNQLTMNDYILVQQPQVSFENAVAVCTNENVPIYNVNVTSLDPVEFYFWDFNGDGNTDATGPSPLFMYDAPGSYSITLEIITFAGCSASYTTEQEINVLTQVDATFTPSTNISCAGEPVIFCVEEQPGNTFSWNFYDGSGWILMPPNEMCISHEYADTGYFDLTLTVFNGACNVLQTIEDFIYIEPPVALFNYAINCDNLMAVQFHDMSILADSLVWDFGDGSPVVINELNPIHQYDSLGVFTAVLTVYNFSQGCPDQQTQTITVMAPQAALSLSPDNGCPPLLVSVYNSVFNTNWNVDVSNGDNFNAAWIEEDEQWVTNYTHDGISESNTYPGIDAGFWPVFSIESGGFYDVVVSVTDPNGCEVSTTYEDAIHVSSNPDFASFSTEIVNACENVQINFAPDLEDLETWQWIFSDGQISSQENPFHQFQPPYNYNAAMTATLTATDSLGCISTVTQNIAITLPPVVNFTIENNPVCIEEVVNFINQSTGPAGTTYSWDFGDPLSADNSSIEFNTHHTYSSNGNYPVCLSADNGQGCVIQHCDVTGVNVVSPEVEFDYTANINNCLYGVSFNNLTPGQILISSWDFGDGQMGAGMSVYHTYPIGVYDVSLSVTNQYGCVSTSMIPDILNYGNQVGPFSTALDSANCAPFDVVLTAFNPNDTYFTYFWDFSDGSGDPSGNTSTLHTFLEAGTYCPSVIMTDPNGCPVLIACTEPIVVDEFVLNYSIPAHICDGDSLFLNIDNASLLVWDDLTFVTQGSNAQQFYLHPDDDQQFILTGYYADCQRTDTFNLVVADLPVVTMDIDPSVCYQDNVFPLAGGLPADPPGIYYVNNVVQNQFDPSWTPGLNYNVTYEYTDSNACTNRATTGVFIHALPVVVFGDPDPACENENNFVLNQATPSGGIYTFLSDTIVSFDPSIGFGQYELNYEFTDVFGCYNSDQANVLIHPVPQAGILFSDICLNQILNIENNSVIALGSIDNVQWNFGPFGSFQTFNLENISFDEIGNYPFLLTQISDQGCVDVLDSTLNIWAVPKAIFSPETSCQFASQLFADSSTIESGNITTWLWNLENQTINSPDSLQYIFQDWGEIDLELMVISDHNCTDSVSHAITVHPAPIVTIEFDDACLGEESVFNASASIPLGGVVFQEWQFGDGSIPELDPAADNLYATVGNYPIQFTATSNLGCTTIITDTLHVYPIPVVDFAIDPNVMCAKDPFTLIDLSSVDQPSQITEWIWWFDDNPISYQQSPQMSWPIAGTYDLTLTVITGHGCSNDSTSNNAATIYPNPTAGFSIPAEIFMYDPSVKVVNFASEDVTDWEYFFGDDSTSFLPEPRHIYNQWGTFNVLQIVANTFSCRDSISHQVIVNPDLLVYIPNAFTPDENTHNDIFKPVVTGAEITFYEFAIFNRWGEQVFQTSSIDDGWDGTNKGALVPDGVYSWVLNILSGKNATPHKRAGTVTVLK
jgi:gliding motility-associated-like protein